MSRKIEISRELAEDLLNPCADFATHDRLRALLDAQGLCGSHTGDSCVHCGGSGLLAAPVVERQEPVFVKPQYLTVKGLWIECEESDPKAVAFFTSPPAPVAVINESKEFNKWWSATEVLKKNKLQIAQEAWQARACLDKVKELNQ